MSYAVPRLHWERLRNGTDRDGRPVLEVPAELSALGPAALALLRVRLAWRCGATEVVLWPAVEVAGSARGRPPEVVVAFVGTSAAAITIAQRDAGDRAVATVAADAAAGWTAQDEAERHRPFAWR